MNDQAERRVKLNEWIVEHSLRAEPYVLLGTAHPERAMLNIPEFSFRGADSVSKSPIVMLAAVINGRISVHLYTDGPRDLMHLKQYAHEVIEGQVAIASFIIGYAFSIEITQVINVGLETNYVYGAPGDGNAFGGEQLAVFGDIRALTTGRLGAFVTRCLGDMSIALQWPRDAAFYCYRAIESLNQHCIEKWDLGDLSESGQWQEFRRRAGCSKEHLMQIKSDADPIRHGNHLNVGSLSNDAVMNMTRTVVASYLGVSQVPVSSLG